MKKSKKQKTVQADSVGLSSEDLLQLEQSLESGVNESLEQFVLDTTQEEKELLATEAEQDESEEEAEVKVVHIDSESAMMVAGSAIEYLQIGLSVGFGSKIEIEDDEREKIANKAVPVIQKYLDPENIPSWFVRWKAEVELSIVLGATIYGAYKESQKEDKKEVKEGKPTKQDYEKVDFNKVSKVESTDDLSFHQ